jgi:hypothetical protein
VIKNFDDDLPPGLDDELLATLDDSVDELSFAELELMIDEFRTLP